MFTQQQAVFLAEIICQYDYYTVYYYGSYKDYTVGETRDNKIQVYCSDQQPVIENGVYFYTDCNYYEITSNKYILMEQGSEQQFSPLSASDIVYTNAVSGMPQLNYTTSRIRQDAAPAILYGTVILVGVAILIRVLFGGKS